MPATKVIPYNDHLQSSYLEVAVKLTSGHFNNGILRLQCTAMVTSIYRETREKILSSKTEPVPERGKNFLKTVLLSKCFFYPFWWVL
jgi:hypothetical protein